MMSQFFQILDCNEQLGSCCSDYGLVTILDIAKKILDLIQLFVPIILMVMLAVQFTLLLINPDDKKKTKSLLNKFIAAIVCFFVPYLVNLSLTLLPSDMETFQLGACWDLAKISSEALKEGNSTYVSTTTKSPQSFLLDPEAYDEITGGGGAVGQASATGQSIVNYALKFVGQPYQYGGFWNGQEPYTPTDCSGFVNGVFAHHGIFLSRSTSGLWSNKNMYTLVSENDIRAGDLVMYNGHVAILTGNGEEIVHASNKKDGVKVTDSYKYRNNILGIMRIKGVN